MRDARPPRGRVLILALGVVLLLMGFAFWRAVAGSKATETAQGNEEAARASQPSAPAPALPPAASGPGGATAPAAPATAQTPHPAHGGPAGAGSPMDEVHLMARLREIKDSDPPGAVALAREGNRRFPDSGDAPERTSILIHALVAADKGSEARGEAEQMVNHYPDSAWVREIERFTGAHRHRNVSVSDAGQLIFR